MNFISRIDDARFYLQTGGVIAYPTEAVYGLGCDPFNKDAVQKLLALKKRPLAKGFIVLIADWAQLPIFIGNVSESKWDLVRDSWPGPVTWLFPKAANVPLWLTGGHPTIAIRMSAHPIAFELCREGPVISTSANLSGQAPAIDIPSLQAQFPEGIDALLEGELGGAKQPSSIFDVCTGRRIR